MAQGLPFEMEETCVFGGSGGGPSWKKLHATTSQGTGMTTSFMLFLKEKREQIIAANPSFQQKEIASMAGQMWKILPIDEKARYKQRSEDLFRQKKLSMCPPGVSSMSEKYPLSNFPININQ